MNSSKPPSDCRRRRRPVFPSSFALVSLAPRLWPRAGSLRTAKRARSDLAIQTDVLKALSSYPDLSGQHITATTKNGVVILAGTASSGTAKSQHKSLPLQWMASSP